MKTEITEQWRQSIEAAAYNESVLSHGLDNDKQEIRGHTYNGFMAGAEFALSELRNTEKPSEELVEQIFKIIDCNSAWNGKLSLQIVTESSIHGAATEIANLVTQREAELLEAANYFRGAFLNGDESIEESQKFNAIIKKYKKP